MIYTLFLFFSSFGFISLYGAYSGTSYENVEKLYLIFSLAAKATLGFFMAYGTGRRQQASRPRRQSGSAGLRLKHGRRSLRQPHRRPAVPGLVDRSRGRRMPRGEGFHGWRWAGDRSVAGRCRVRSRAGASRNESRLRTRRGVRVQIGRAHV